MTQEATTRTSEELDRAALVRNELAAWRLLIQSDYAEYRQWVRREIYPKFITSWWILDLAREMQEFYRAWRNGESPMLAICAPPQHGKSWNSEDFLTWCIGKHPEFRYLYAAFSKDLGERCNASIQRLMETERFRLAFDTRLPTPGRSEGGMVRNSTHLSFLGEIGDFRNTTTGGAITGHGFDLLVFDDLIKGRAEARSKLIRDTTWDWFTDDAFTRRTKGAGILFTTTRWHLDDPLGRMQERFGKALRVITYPAIATNDEQFRKKGEVLFPEHKPLDEIQKIKTAMTAASFEALYQQHPSVEGGELFPVDKITVLPVAPAPSEVLRTVRAWDKSGTGAAKAKATGSHTVGVRMSLLRDGRFVIEDVCRGQWTALEREQRIKQICIADNAERPIETWIEQEPGSGGLESAENTIRNLRGYVVKKDRPTGSKEIRAEPFAAQWQGGNVSIVGGPFVRAFLDEAEMFPNGPTMDQIDAASMGFAKLLVAQGSQHIGW